MIEAKELYKLIKIKYMKKSKYIFILNDTSVLEIKKFKSRLPVEMALGYLEKLKELHKGEITCYVEMAH